MASLAENPFISLTPTHDDSKNQEMVQFQEIAVPALEENPLDSTTTFPPREESKLSAGHHKYLNPFISERTINQSRPLKVIYIGAGISGILAAIHFRKAVPNLDLVLYEKNPEIGGTWYENKYPGCACGWSQFFSGAEEILAYWKRVVQKYDVRKHVRFSSRCVGARWNDKISKWFVQILNLETGETFEDSADLLMTGTGLLNEWKWPSIPGLQSFRGRLLHSACWDETWNSENQHIAVIGAGSSGIQIVPALVDKVKAMDHYVRGRTWISNQHGGDRLASKTDGKGGNFVYTEEERQAWRADPAAYMKYRKDLEFEMQTLYAKSQRGSDLQVHARAQYKADMEHRLREKPELLKHLLPDFPPLCKRLTPGPGYLEALASPKVELIPTGIVRIDETGVITSDGKHRAVDAIVCATGFETNPGGGFPIIGRDGVNIRQKYAERPESYLGLCTDGFPNFFQSLGPNSFQGAGNLLIMMEQIHSYVAGIVSRMAYDNIGCVEPKRRAVENFTNFAERYFERTVYSEECASWYKSSPPGALPEKRRKGRVTALWPGSSLHALKALEKVRWEDFETQNFDGNEFGWFGNGWTAGEKTRKVEEDNITWYLKSTGFLDDVDPLAAHDNY